MISLHLFEIEIYFTNEAVFPEYNSSAGTLGVFLAPDENNEEMVQHLRQKAKRWKSNIQSGHLNIHEAFLVLVRIILRSLLYHLPVLILTEEECSYTKVPFISTVLALMA